MTKDDDLQTNALLLLFYPKKWGRIEEEEWKIRRDYASSGNPFGFKRRDPLNRKMRWREGGGIQKKLKPEPFGGLYPLGQSTFLADWILPRDWRLTRHNSSEEERENHAILCPGQERPKKVLLFWTIKRMARGRVLKEKVRVGQAGQNVFPFLTLYTFLPKTSSDRRVTIELRVYRVSPASEWMGEWTKKGLFVGCRKGRIKRHEWGGMNLWGKEHEVKVKTGKYQTRCRKKDQKMRRRHKRIRIWIDKSSIKRWWSNQQVCKDGTANVDWIIIILFII